MSGIFVAVTSVPGARVGTRQLLSRHVGQRCWGGGVPGRRAARVHVGIGEIALRAEHSGTCSSRDGASCAARRAPRSDGSLSDPAAPAHDHFLAECLSLREVPGGRQ